MRRTADGGRSSVDCPLPERAVFSLAVSAATGRSMRVPSQAGCSAATTAAETGVSSRRCSTCPRGPPGAFRRGRGRRTCAGSRLSPHEADLLPVGIQLGGLTRHRRRRALAGSPARAPAGRARPPTALAREGLRGRRWRRRLQRGRWRETAARGRGARPPLHVVGRRRSQDPEAGYVSASTGPYAAHGRPDPQARIYRRRDGDSWAQLAGGLPEPLVGDALCAARN